MAASSTSSNKIGIVQVTCGANKQDNFDMCKSLIKEAKSQGAKMVFLPEACDYIESSVEASLAKAEPLEGEFISNYRKLAADLDIWISIGSFHRRVESSLSVKNLNTQVIVDNKGEIKSVYDKLHLFEINHKSSDGIVTNLKESNYTEPGGRFGMPVETPVGVVGTSICYDLRFPQMSTLQRKLGAQILTYPSVFTVATGRAQHWEVLLRARAVENQCYVIASAQVGQHNEKRSSYGHSLVVDPWGKVLVDCDQEAPCVKIIDIDLSYLNEVRASMPVNNSVRTDLYSNLPFILKSIDQETYSFAQIKVPNACVFFESLHTVAFVNLRPIVPGHVLICPKQVRVRVEDMTDEEALDLFYASKLIAAKLEKHYQATSINFGIQDGPESGQSVKHVHMHILPRRVGDFKKDEIYDKMEKHDKEDNGIRARSHEEMGQEATVLRGLFYEKN